MKAPSFILRFSLALLISIASVYAEPIHLPRSTSEAQGVSSQTIRTFVEATNQNVDTMHSFMLVRHGFVIAEAWWKPQAAETPHIMNSLSKSFTSTAVGLAVAEGKISIDDPVLKIFPRRDSLPAFQKSERHAGLGSSYDVDRPSDGAEIR